MLFVEIAAQADHALTPLQQRADLRRLGRAGGPFLMAVFLVGKHHCSLRLKHRDFFSRARRSVRADSPRPS